ncbi:Protein POLLEN DEFECTIVE IN GUIDANCE 1, partial [Mucuna pruriens]
MVHLRLEGKIAPVLPTLFSVVETDFAVAGVFSVGRSAGLSRWSAGLSRRSVVGLRQRNVSCGSSEDITASVVRDESAVGKEEGPVEKATNEPDRNMVTKLETVELLDWKRLMAEDPNDVFSVEKSPVTYFLEEMYNGNSLRSTTTLGNES